LGSGFGHNFNFKQWGHVMPDLTTFAITFVIAMLAAIFVAWLVGHVPALAEFTNLDQA
jgi:ABC-type nitrate/sulfonate/bicarbonate transport system permease component